MRPEYVEAVNAVRWGFTLWIVFIVPTLLIGGLFVVTPISRAQPQWTHLLVIFAAAVFTSWLLTLLHVEYLQATKFANAQTTAEQEDWASDTWRVFAPVTSIPYTVGFCSLVFLTAWVARLIIVGLARLKHRTRNPDKLPG